MKEVLLKAIDSFIANHEDRCVVPLHECFHFELIGKAQLALVEDEPIYQQSLVGGKLKAALREKIIAHVSEQIVQTREEWLDVQNFPENSFASWVYAVFDVALKAVGEIK